MKKKYYKRKLRNSTQYLYEYNHDDICIEIFNNDRLEIYDDYQVNNYNDFISIDEEEYIDILRYILNHEKILDKSIENYIKSKFDIKSLNKSKIIIMNDIPKVIHCGKYYTSIDDIIELSDKLREKIIEIHRNKQNDIL